MERQPIKILFLYFGQPRMVKECIPWHDHSIKYLKSLDEYDIQVDLDYHLWTQKTTSSAEFSYYNEGKKIKYNTWKTIQDVDCNKIENDILNNRVEGSKVTCNFYSYEIVEELYDMLSSSIDRDLFFGTYAQNVIKGLACKNISDEYDIVFLTRTDLIQNPKYDDEQFKNFFIKYYEKVFNKKKQKNNDRLIQLLTLSYIDGIGAMGDDRCLLGQPSSLKKFFANYNEKINSYIKNIGETEIDPGRIWISLGYFYNKMNESKEAPVYFKEYRINPDFTIAYEIEEIMNCIDTINEESFYTILKTHNKKNSK